MHPLRMHPSDMVYYSNDYNSSILFEQAVLHIHPKEGKDQSDPVVSGFYDFFSSTSSIACLKASFGSAPWAI